MKKILLVLTIALSLQADILPTIKNYDENGKAVFGITTQQKDIKTNQEREKQDIPNFDKFENNDNAIYKNISVSVIQGQILKDYGNGYTNIYPTSKNAVIGSNFALEFDYENNQYNGVKKIVWCSYRVYKGHPILFIDIYGDKVQKINITEKNIKVNVDTKNLKGEITIKGFKY